MCDEGKTSIPKQSGVGCSGHAFSHSGVVGSAERFPERLVVVKSPSGSRVRWAG